MSTMDGMLMPGGWIMSMTWMPGQDWSGAAMSYLGMWVVMMMAMMMPSLVPMLLRSVAVGVVILIAGLLQFTGWKAQQLACCRQAAGCSGTIPASVGEAWRQGLRFGLHCSQCCLGLIITLLVVGVMDLRMMAVVAAAITAERFAPERVPVAQIIGVLVTGAGVFIIGRAIF